MAIDAVGKACPMPVIMAKKALDEGNTDVTVVVDNETAVQNLTRFGESRDMTVTCEEKNGAFYVRIAGEGAGDKAEENEPKTAGYSVFIGKDHLGEGEGELGANLLKMALYTLSQGDDVPQSLLFMNGGVKLPAGDDKQIIDSINDMISKGTVVLVCGTCLNFYGLSDSLKVGTVSNMYDILEKMKSADKVISL